MTRKRKIANVILALLLCSLIFGYLFCGHRLMDSERVYVRRAGRTSLRMQIALGLVSPESLVHLIDVAIKHTTDREYRQLLDLITSGYDSLSNEDKKIFVAGIEEMFLDPPSYEHFGPVCYQWPDKLSPDCVMKGLLSNNFDVRLFAGDIIGQRRADFKPEELSHTMAKLLKDGVSFDDEWKISNALSISINLDLMDFLNNHKSIIQEQSKSKYPITRQLARRALKKIDETNDKTAGGMATPKVSP